MKQEENRRKLKEKLLDFLFTRRCELCGEVCALNENLCKDCKKIKALSEPLCTYCIQPESKCNCKKKGKKPSFDFVFAPYYFEGSIKDGVYRFKNGGYTELSDSFSKEIAYNLLPLTEGTKIDVITFVPMTKKKEKKRGYNQSERLAKSISKTLDIPFKELLIKVRDTDSQRISTAEHRRINLYGAFDCTNGVEFDGKTVLIVDDVITTGSTLNECATVLKAYGANKVIAAAYTTTKRNV